MRFLAYSVLLSAIVISACGAYFSIVGLKLLFVGGGISIIIMGSALEIGKLITATFLKQKWNDIGLWMKTYMTLATFFLMFITSIGIYGYLSAGYTTTSIAVQGYERQIEANITNINEMDKEIASLKTSTYNEAEIRSIEDNRKKIIEQRTLLINQKSQQTETIRKSTDTNKDASADIISAKQALELSKSSTDSDIGRELEQIKLYNSRLEILDKEVQKWIDQGSGNIFKKGGLDKAREIKQSQQKERDDIDTQIKSSQDRIEKLRQQYASQVKEYNDRVVAIESRGKSQRSEIDTNIKNVEKESAEIAASITAYNKETDEKIVALNTKKGEMTEQSKQKITEYQNNIQALRAQNTDTQQKIVNTDVGTFKFIAKSLNIPLDDAVNYFIWTIIAVFDPLAICLILAFNTLIGTGEKSKNKQQPKIVTEPEPTPTSTPTPTTAPTSTPEPTPTSDAVAEDVLVNESVVVDVVVSPESISPDGTLRTSLPPAPINPHGISSGKVKMHKE
jgi:hypothetical protein